MISRFLRAPVVLLGALCLACGGTDVVSTAAQGGDRHVLSEGHVDMNPRIINGAFRIQVRDDNTNPPTYRELDDVIARGTDDVKMTVPASETFRFLGTPRESIWVLPQVQRAGVIWLGWGSQDPSILDGIDGAITWTLRSIDGPGKLTLFLNDGFGVPTTIFDGNKPYPQSTPIPLNSHVHANWAFSKPGIYRLAVEMTAKGKNGSTLTDTKTLAMAIGDADPKQVPRGGSTGGGTGIGTGSGSGSGSGTGGGNQAAALPNTGAGDLALLAGGGAALLIVAQALRWRLRRRVGGR